MKCFPIYFIDYDNERIGVFSCFVAKCFEKTGLHMVFELALAVGLRPDSLNEIFIPVRLVELNCQ